MINYQYHPNWNATLLDQCNNLSSARCTDLSEAIVCCLYNKNPALTDIMASNIVKIVIEKMFNAFDSDGSLFGLFSLLSTCNKRVSPFIATRDYRVRVKSIDSNGIVAIDISPIYRLGPDYPDRYQQQYGKVLAKEAIVGLIEPSIVELQHDCHHQTYLLGIDAGMAFKDSNIQHTKSMTLLLSLTNQTATAALQCETETMSKTLPWEQFSISEFSEPKNQTQRIAGTAAA